MFAHKYVAVITLWLFASNFVLAQDKTLFIGQIQVEDLRNNISNQLPLKYEFIHENPLVLQQHLDTWFPQSVQQSTSVAVRAEHYPRTKEPRANKQHHAATFLIDYKEPSIQQLGKDIKSAYGNAPSAKDLEQFVYDFISDKNYANGFDIASQVAHTQEGDCTEHAVLLAALLRMYGYPARVVTGVYISLDDPTVAYGHAWTEYYTNNSWNGLDATRVSPTVGQLHVPLAVIENETIGYSVGLIKAIQTLAIKRVIVSN